MDLGDYLLHCMFLVLSAIWQEETAGSYHGWSMVRATALLLAVVVGCAPGRDCVIAPDTALLTRLNRSMSSVFNTLEDAKDLRAKHLQLQHDGLLKVGGCLSVDIETHGV